MEAVDGALQQARRLLDRPVGNRWLVAQQEDELQVFPVGVDVAQDHPVAVDRGKLLLALSLLGLLAVNTRLLVDEVVVHCLRGRVGTLLFRSFV